MNSNPNTRSCFPFVARYDDAFETVFATETYAWKRTSCSSWICVIENCSDCRGCCDKQTMNARETEEEKRLTRGRRKGGGTGAERKNENEKERVRVRLRERKRERVEKRTKRRVINQVIMIASLRRVERNVTRDLNRSKKSRYLL